MPAPKYILMDAEERHRAHPTTFEIPPRDDRNRLKPGDMVKLVFMPGDRSPGGERLWVTIKESIATVPRRYMGQLENHAITTPLKLGDRVDFGAEHIIEIMRRAS